MKKTDNKGFSLVELIVVIAIVSVLIGMFTFGYSLISNKQVDQCAKKIQITLESARATSLGKHSVDLKFLSSGGKIYLEKKLDGDAAQVSRTEIGDGKLSVIFTFEKNGSADQTKNVATTNVTGIVFDRASGSVKADASGYYFNHVTISNGRKEMTVSVDKLTGRVTID